MALTEGDFNEIVTSTLTSTKNKRWLAFGYVYISVVCYC